MADISCCKGCGYIIRGKNGNSKCVRCGGEFVNLRISSEEWDSYTEQKRNEIIGRVIDGMGKLSVPSIEKKKNPKKNSLIKKGILFIIISFAIMVAIIFIGEKIKEKKQNTSVSSKNVNNNTPVSGFRRIQNKDEFGDATGDYHLTYSTYLSGKYSNEKKKDGLLKWNIVINPSTGYTFFRLREEGEDRDVTTSSEYTWILLKDTIYTISIKDDNDEKYTLYGCLIDSETYKSNCLLLCNSFGVQNQIPVDCRELFQGRKALKIVITSEHGSYNLGTLDLSSLQPLIE